MASNNKEVTGWVGWIFFAGFMMILLGFFQALAGLTAIFNSDWLVITEETFVTVDLTAWGWFHLLLGVVVLWAGIAVMQGAAWARMVGVIVAVLSAVANLASVNSYPIWSLILVTVNILIIYALTVHGDELQLD